MSGLTTLELAVPPFRNARQSCLKTRRKKLADEAVTIESPGNRFIWQCNEPLIWIRNSQIKALTSHITDRQQPWHVFPFPLSASPPKTMLMPLPPFHQFRIRIVGCTIAKYFPVFRASKLRHTCLLHQTATQD
jgi:hypothetical protein